mmetsp:Transcript_32161/g.99130  ORF Transcript_32161/g.99130 Transcript_32161/m.99130 type:complete len:400 (-) Transcript_32161:84-1283(-)
MARRVRPRPRRQLPLQIDPLAERGEGERRARAAARDRRAGRRAAVRVLARRRARRGRGRHAAPPRSTGDGPPPLRRRYKRGQGHDGPVAPHRARLVPDAVVLGALGRGRRRRDGAAAVLRVAAGGAHGPRRDARLALRAAVGQLLVPVHRASLVLQRLRVDPAAPDFAPPVHERARLRRGPPPLRARATEPRGVVRRRVRREPRVDVLFQGLPDDAGHVAAPAAADRPRETDAELRRQYHACPGRRVQTRPRGVDGADVRRAVLSAPRVWRRRRQLGPRALLELVAVRGRVAHLDRHDADVARPGRVPRRHGRGRLLDRAPDRALVRLLGSAPARARGRRRADRGPQHAVAAPRAADHRAVSVAGALRRVCRNRRAARRRAADVQELVDGVGGAPGLRV